MQKRTNPLALKNDAKPEELRAEQPIEAKSPETKAPVQTAQAAPRREPPIHNGMTTSRIKKASEFSASGSVVTSAPKAEPTVSTTPYSKPSYTEERSKDETRSASPAETLKLKTPIEDAMVSAYEEPELYEDDDVSDETPIAPADLYKQDEAVDSADVIEDEEPFPTLHDFELAAHFSLRGKISRKTVIGKVSRDVCRLSQLLHPDEKLSTIIENALLTRIFLENPEAFDAMAVVIEEKGGRIKC